MLLKLLAIAFTLSLFFGLTFAESIPSPFKEKALLWSQGNIPTTEFVRDIEFMIENQFITTPTTFSEEINVPHWFKNNAGWWANSQISDSDYLGSMQFLINENIISVKSLDEKSVEIENGELVFVFHWEQDESISGYEYSSFVNKPLQIVFLEDQISIPNNAAAQKLQHDYGILLSDEELDWQQDHAFALLEMMKIIPQDTRNYYEKQNLINSKWIPTNEHIEDDIIITKDGSFQAVIISTDAFENANPKLALIDEKRGKYFSQKLHHALVRFVTDGGNDKDAVEKILNERFGVSTRVPDFLTLTSATTNESANSFQEFHPLELVEIINMFEEMPDGFHSLEGLNYLVRRADGVPHPLYPQAPAVSWPTINPGYIEFMESAFRVDDNYLHKLIIHEKSHFLWSQLFSEQLKSNWIQIGGWYFDDGQSKWFTTKTTEFVSPYAHQNNPDEDIAESIAYFVTDPDKLKSRALPKFDFIRDGIMQGNIYLSKIREDLTFEVYNLFPDYIYPGKIIRVGITIVGSEQEDKNGTIEIELSNINSFQGATSAYLRLFSEIGTFEDIYLSPINGELDSVLKGHVSIDKNAKNGFWYTDQIVVTDQTGNQRFEGQNDFGWRFFINNSDEDTTPPEYVENTLTLDSRIDTTYQNPVQVLTVSWEVVENQEMKNCFTRIVHKDPKSYSMDSWGIFDTTKKRCNVDFILTEYNLAGNYVVRYLMMGDKAGNTGQADFTKLAENHTILISTKDPDTKVPYLDINNIEISALPTNPQAPNGETQVQIVYLASDDKSGLGLVSYSLRDPQGIDHFEYHYHENFYSLFFVGNPNELQPYEINLLLPEGSPPGTWGLSHMTLVDKANNQKTYEFTEIIHFEVE